MRRFFGSEPATVIFNVHPLDPRKHSHHRIFVDGLQDELDVGKHDVRGASGDQVEIVAVLFSRLDLARGIFAAQPIRIDDEASAIDTGILREGDLLSAAAAHEHLVAAVGIRRPGAGQICRIGTAE